MQENGDKMTTTGKAETQERILAAAFDLFVENGYPATTMQAIATQARVSRATVFWHFGSKADLFRGVLERLLAPIRASLSDESTGLPPAKKLTERIATANAYVQSHQQEIVALIRWAAEDADLQGHVRAEIIAVTRKFSSALTSLFGEIAPAGSSAQLLSKGVELAVYGSVLVSVLDPAETAIDERRQSVDELIRVIQGMSDKN